MINFTGKIIADKSLFQYKTNGKEIFEHAKLVTSIPAVSYLLEDDEIILSRKGSEKTDKITINCNQKEEIEIVKPKEIPPSAVVCQILFYACYRNGKIPRSMTLKNIISTIRQILEEKGAN